MNLPKVGIGVIIENEAGEILIGKRKGSHAPYYSIPGGHLELDETFEGAAIREVLEETGLSIGSPEVVAVTNNLETFKEFNVHFVSVIMHTNQFKGNPAIKEPDKCEGWQWVNPYELPQPHFDASAYGIRCFLEGKHYISPKI